MNLGPLCGMVVAAGLLTVPPLMGTSPLLVWNGSPSVTRGLYVVDRAPPKIGDLVLIRLPTRLAALAARRGYLPRRAFLIKPVVALAGASVCRHGARIYVGSKLAAVARSVDHAGRPLPSWHGCRTVQSGEVFLLAHHPDGFDSRYFGALPIRTVVGRAAFVRPGFARW